MLEWHVFPTLEYLSSWYWRKNRCEQCKSRFYYDHSSWWWSRKPEICPQHLPKLLFFPINLNCSYYTSACCIIQKQFIKDAPTFLQVLEVYVFPILEYLSLWHGGRINVSNASSFPSELTLGLTLIPPTTPRTLLILFKHVAGCSWFKPWSTWEWWMLLLHIILKVSYVS